MPRRRKRNPLLMRIMVFTAIFHMIAIPIAAHFGAFDKLKRQFGEARVVLLPPPPQEKEKQQAKTKAKPKVDKSKSATKVVKRGGAAKPNPNLHKVEASNAPAGEGEATIQQGTQVGTGEVPTTPSKTTVASTAPTTNTAPTTTTTPVKPPVTTVTPPTSTPPVVATTTPKHVPVYVEPEQDYSPQPAIPDDLRTDSLSKDFVAMVTVAPDGTVKTLKVSQSTGIKELDDVATSTLKTWRFKPATLDGAGTDGAVKLTIQFRVE